MCKKIAAFILIFLLIVSATPVSAQTPTPPPGPVYIVQEGDTLWGIASHFGVNLADLQAINNLTGADIYPGDKLVIPGLEDLSGTLVTLPVPFGETLRSLERQYRMSTAVLRKLNHLVSPSELYAGYGLIVLQQDNQPARTARAMLGKGDTLLELAVRQNTDPWTIAGINALAGPASGLPGDVLYLPSGDSTASSMGLPPSIVSAQIDPLPITQGVTVQLKIVTSQPATLGGLLVKYPLHFFPLDDGSQVALQGIHAMTTPGLYPLRIDVTLADGNTQSFEQMIMVTGGNYGQDPALEVDPATIDPAVTGPEDQWLTSLVSTVTPDKYWQGIFQLPVAADSSCIRSYFGNRRSYNNGALLSFHTGIDFGVCSATHPFDVYAPADGVVVFTGLKTVRGNATIIDHGWGIYSGLYHQEEIYVAVGDHVTQGQLIGKIGETGRVTGKHLHWDVWVNGVQVNPLQWLDETFPH